MMAKWRRYIVKQFQEYGLDDLRDETAFPSIIFGNDDRNHLLRQMAKANSPRSLQGRALG
jgi:hypothetical protein